MGLYVYLFLCYPLRPQHSHHHVFISLSLFSPSSSCSILWEQEREEGVREEIKIRELVSTVGSLRYEEVDGVRKEKERLTTDHQSYLPPYQY